jgi:hypothetical protein
MRTRGLDPNLSLGLAETIKGSQQYNKFSKAYNRMFTDQRGSSDLVSEHQEYMLDTFNALDEIDCPDGPDDIHLEFDHRTPQDRINGLDQRAGTLGGHTFKRVGTIRQLRHKILTPINIAQGKTNSFHISTKEKLYPLKIRFFSDQPTPDLMIAASFSQIPSLHHHDMLVSGKTLTLTPKMQQDDENNLLQITIFAMTNLLGHIGVAFRGINIISRGQF